MNLRTAGAIAATIVSVSAGQALAATVIFDDFTANQMAVDVAYPGSEASSTIAFGGGSRTLTADNTSATSSAVAATILESSGGSLSFSNRDGATGSATLTYTGVGDISWGANPYFLFDVGYFDNIAEFSVMATDSLGNVSTYSEVLSGAFSPYLYFSAFTGLADFNDLAELSFKLDTTNVPGFGPIVSVDGSLNSISIGATPVPLPATALLLLGAVGGLGGIRAMSRRKSA